MDTSPQDGGRDAGSNRLGNLCGKFEIGGHQTDAEKCRTVLRYLVCEKTDLSRIRSTEFILSPKVVGSDIKTIVLKKRVKHVDCMVPMVVQADKRNPVLL